MSGIPSLRAESGTPATEGAARTTTITLEPNAATTDTLGKDHHLPLLAERTPSQEIPGAFPNMDALPPREPETVQTEGETATNLLKAAETIGRQPRLHQSVAVDTDPPFIPDVPNLRGLVIASEHDHPHTTSLPSTELAGASAGEHSEGVGALPGPITESGVIRLPGERDTLLETPTAAGSAPAAAVKQTGQETTQQVKEKTVALAVCDPATTKDSLPSEEEQGAKPGEHTKPGVATFPDENLRGATNATASSVNTHGSTYDAAALPSQDGSTSVSSGTGALPGRAGEEGVASLPDERSGAGFVAGSGVATASLPSRETSGARPYERHSDGAGALPGKNAEAAVVLPPDERNKIGLKETEFAGAGAVAVGMDKPEFRQSPDKQVGEDAAAMTDAARGEQEERSSAKSRESKGEPERESKKAPGEKAAAEDKPQKSGPRKGKPNQVGGYDTDYHPAELHPARGDYSQEHAQRGQEKEPAAEKDSEKPVTGAERADSKQASHAESTGSVADQDQGDHDKAKKVGFMTKVKEEAKILLGMVEGKKGHERAKD